jgi:hypothetical protein
MLLDYAGPQKRSYAPKIKQIAKTPAAGYGHHVDVQLVKLILERSTLLVTGAKRLARVQAVILSSAHRSPWSCAIVHNGLIRCSTGSPGFIVVIEHWCSC